MKIFKTGRKASISAFLAFPAVALAFSEAVAARNPSAVFHVVSAHPGSALFSYFWIGTFFALLFLVFGAYAPALVLASLLVLASSHAEKLRSLWEPLYLTDVLAQATQLGGLSSFSWVFWKPATWFALVALLVFSIAFFFLLRGLHSLSEDVRTPSGRMRSRIWKSAVFAGLGVFHAATFSNSFGFLTMVQTAVALKPEDYSWRQLENYEDNGFVGGFFTNIGNAFVKKPADYDRAEVEKTALAPSGSLPSASGSVRPDVVLVLSESFWDPTKLPGVVFSEDPIPNFRKLRQEYGGGDFVSPMFWGKTALVEFEVLTGTPIAWLPDGSIPYQQYLRNPVPSVPFEFRGAGYSAEAVHTYHKSFFNRSWAYPFLGFEEFVGLEDLPNAPVRGKFVSDAVLTDTVLSRLRERREPSKPSFVFAISMENHFSYEGDKYADHDIGITAPSLSDDDLLTLKNYVQGLRNADAELARMVRELEKSERPTVLAFFGDHMGILGERYRIYGKTGYLRTLDEGDWTREEYLSMHTTPFLVWGNFDSRQVRKDFWPVRASNFADVVFDLAGISAKSPVFHAWSKVAECLPASAPLDAVGCQKELSVWKNLQYYHLFDSK